MICPICEKKMIEKKALNKPLYYCSACDFLTKGKTLNASLEKERYDSHICDDAYLEYMHNVYLKIKNLIKKGKILDFGCGKIHALADILANNGYESYYYDKYYFPKLLPLKYETIILIEVIEHILDLNELFLKLNSLLASKGRLIIMTNFIPDDYLNWWYIRDTTHVNFYSKKAFQALMLKYGYSLVYCDDKSLICLEKN